MSNKTVTRHFFGCCSWEDSFTPGVDTWTEEMTRGWGKMEEALSTGSYVSSEDYDAAEAQLRTANEERHAARLACGLACELHACASRACNANQYLVDAQEMMATVAQQAATISKLREALIAIGRNMGCLLADEVSDDFLLHLKEESAHWAKLPKEKPGNAK